MARAAANEARTRTGAIVAAVLLACPAPIAAQEPARRLVAITAPQHDPLYLDAATIKRNGANVSFKYLLDVLAPLEEGAKAQDWRSNEIEASIDCRKRTVIVRSLVAYSGPRGAGSATAVHSFTGPGIKPEPIAPNSTFAYLEGHVCRGG